ncbi:hypothetical protein LAV73_08570 [Lysinibacillus xylanilyticus]|uniref:hypothetical protein n=1 Tax=Lysinibacillus xylanilyticus TaxID=582475 RepID=UPI002B24BC7B|nr:hypothetical protein [Lysinibacillus xylanilyticus]MEB2280054.1 hypothetical protein [Lysinibacillus xylanilyticus]
MKIQYFISIALFCVAIKFSIITYHLWVSFNIYSDLLSTFGNMLTSAPYSDSSIVEHYTNDFTNTSENFYEHLIQFGSSASTGLTCIIAGTFFLFERSTESLVEFFKNLMGYIS